MNSLNDPQRLHRSRSSHGECGFNLIEVTLAVAVVALGLIAVLGLLPVGVDSARRVADDTVITTLVGDMFHWRRVCPFNNPSYLPSGNNTRLSLPRPKTSTVLFDANGYVATDKIYTDSNSPFFNKFRPHFRFTYEVKDQPQFPNSADVAQVVITVEWPMINTTTLAPNSQRRVFVSNFARQQ